MPGRFAFASLVLLSLFAAQTSWACACGCGLFDVGTSSLYSSDSGGIVFMEYDYLDQNQNRSGSSTAPASANDDQEIRTDFLTLGGKYMVNRAWGAQVEVPYWMRDYRSVDDDGNAQEASHSAIGDIRLRGIYTGASNDMSTGLTFGLKLPTGDWQAPGFDRDTEIGTGSTDLLVGVYHLGWLTSNNLWSWFAQLNFDQPILIQAGYRPGAEIDAAWGVHYEGWHFGGAAHVAPLLQAIASIRAVDTGFGADSLNTGYQRLLIAPSLEGAFDRVRVYAEVGFGAYTHANGDQLFGSPMYKFLTGFDF